MLKPGGYRAILLFIAVTALSASAHAQSVTTHRAAAGTLDDEGWVEATSTLGNYSVKLPGKFNDLTMAQQNPKSAVEKAEILTTTTVQRIHFTTTRMHFRQGNASARKQYEKLKASSGKPPYKSVKPMSHKGREALEAEIEAKNTVVLQRTVLLDDDVFTMIVEYPKAQEAVAQRLAPVFFESVTFH